MKSHFFAWAMSGAVIFLTAPSSVALTFNLIAEDGTPQYALDAFTSAAGLWSACFANDITVNISVGYASLGSGILGQTSCSFTEVSYSSMKEALNAGASSSDDFSAYQVLQSGSSYSRLINHTSDNPDGANSAKPYVDVMNRVGVTLANARALGLYSASDAALDASIQFSSNFAFDFNRADGITFGQYDFVGMAAHEIGHVLGFVSGVDDIDAYQGSDPGGNFSSNLVDLFRYSQLSLETGAGVTDYTADNREKYFSVDGGVSALAPFSTGLTYGDGHQASHWEDNLGIGIMDPTAAPGEQLNLSEMDLRLMDVLGFTLTSVPEPTAATVLAVGGMMCFLQGRRRRRFLKW